MKSLDGDKVHEIPRGANPAFSDDGRWIGYFIAPPAAEGRGRGRGARGQRGQAQGGAARRRRPARPFEVIDLATGTKSPFPSVGNFAFSPDGEWLLLRPHRRGGAAARPAAAAGAEAVAAQAAGRATATRRRADLLMRRLATGEQRFLAQVAAYAFDDAGKQMAYTVRGQGRLGNGVYVMTLATGEQRTLDAAAADYDQLAWSSRGSATSPCFAATKRAASSSATTSCSPGAASAPPQTQAAHFDPGQGIRPSPPAW